MRAAYALAKRRTRIDILITVVALGFCVWALRYLPSGVGSLVCGLALFYGSAGIAFGSKESLRSNAENIGTRNPTLARAAGIVCLLAAGALVVTSIVHLLHKP